MNKKLAFGLLFLLISLVGLPAFAQTPLMPFKNIIIVVQENRTPDNLFQDQHLIDNGADILPGNDLSSPGSAACEYGAVPLYAWPSLDACFDPDHLHYTAFTTTWNSGDWNGACSTYFKIINPPDCFTAGDGYGNYANYTYVQNYSAGNGYNILDPYFEIAENYGFASYMFQTNQGPSYPAHQFPFSGTSAPVGYDADGDYNYEMFASEIPFTGNTEGEDALDNLMNYAGCGSYFHSWEYVNHAHEYEYIWTQEYDVESFNGGSGTGLEGFEFTSNGDLGFPCYSHPSMADLITTAGYSWKYYVQSTAEDNEIWAAPNSLSAICPFDPGVACSGTPWTSHVDDTMGDILNDIHNCNLQNVSWVIPDGTWSDHPGYAAISADGGPSWVAAIVNAIGGSGSYAPASGCSSSNPQMYWSGSQPTLILVTWDDWGGWFDHVTPWLPGNGMVSGGYGTPDTDYDANDGAYYVYGFRVPLLVVSAYNNKCAYPATCYDSFTGYISGTSSQGGEVQPYVHDFGSILGFIEWNFGLSPYDGGSSCGIAGGDSTNFPDGCNYEFADWFAPDGSYECGLTTDPSNCGEGETTAYPLEDFFNFTDLSSPNGFTAIAGAKYPPNCFVADYATTPCFGVGFAASDPDDDVIEAEQ
jgi:hypothetical protein